ncbi:zf-TFIIB domain-containing protein [Massilia pseudoviolaceinigra]|uniref:zf-TFIIB domain-containing protein n=1 Tax=Massilia pseudoviolaceinigra TaxID=3057165 RepID=UPI0027964808|nr:zf-TFIIB domain-containing protein [Massilia sp. CCM 9206]MDQ1919174.1 zf-TFIIB domain-containing protein [Massilia sp. CCM 9206]
MICPACGGRHVASVKIEGGLPAERCKDCHGAWVELERYRLWRKRTPQLAAPEYDGEISQASEPARVCPNTGRLMTRLKVSNDNPLRLDYSAMAQAVWFDKGEWERVLAMGLHDQLDAIVSERWQSDLKRAAARERAEHAMRLRFGDDAYEQLVHMRAWLAQQPNQSDMMAFLNTKAD